MVVQTTYKEKYEEATLQIVQLKHELGQLKRLIFGSKHERFIPLNSPEQLSLGFNIDTVQTPLPEETIQYTRKKTDSTDNSKSTKARMILPANLPREDVIIEPNEDVTGWKKIGEEITEELEATEMKFFVRRYIRSKYAKPNNEGVVIGNLPSRVIDKGIAGPGLLTMIIIGKFIDHLPVYRQIEQFKRSGVTLSASTISDWVDATCKLLSPLYEKHKTLILSEDYIQADETPIKVLDKDKKGTTHRGFHWVYHSPVKRMVLFDYRPGRGREGPAECLKDFKGYLQSDGYDVYVDFGNKSGITLLNCMAHARRKFDESLNYDPVRAKYVLTEIQKLYAIERIIREQNYSHEEAYTLRNTDAIPVLNHLKEWFIENYAQVLPQSTIGKAINYSLHRWSKLNAYTENGKLQIDNNLVENAIRPVAVGKKNYLFAGSHEGAKRAAMLYSLLETCKKCGVNPFEWLKDVLERLPNHPVNKLENLLPHNWIMTNTNPQY
jgi:transposase